MCIAYLYLRFRYLHGHMYSLEVICVYRVDAVKSHAMFYSLGPAPGIQVFTGQVAIHTKLPQTVSTRPRQPQSKASYTPTLPKQGCPNATNPHTSVKVIREQAHVNLPSLLELSTITGGRLKYSTMVKISIPPPLERTETFLCPSSNVRTNFCGLPQLRSRAVILLNIWGRITQKVFMIRPFPLNLQTFCAPSLSSRKYLKPPPSPPNSPLLSMCCIKTWGVVVCFLIIHYVFWYHRICTPHSTT